MSEEVIDRKITVIFATDVVEYSKHMEADESGTVTHLRACEKILSGLFGKHKGRLFNTGGDSFLAEFPSAVSAIECAVEFQKAIMERNSSEEAKVKLKFRIGINSGDVIKEKDNLLGDGVNIAARLEALAQSGGITVSKVIYDFVKGKTQYEFNDLGLQKVKQNEFHAFDLLLEPSQKRQLKSSSRKNITIPVLAAIVVVCLIGFFALYPNFSNKINEGTQSGEFKSNKPVILVKPFSSIGQEGDLASQAITESLISNLLQYGGIKTLSSSTSFAIVEKSFSDDDLKEQFDVSYVISGNIQAFGKTSRLYVELADLSTQQAIMSIKKDFKLENIFEVQDEIGRKILEKIQVEAVEGTKALTSQRDFNTYEQFLLSINRDVEWSKWTKEGNTKAMQITKRLEALGVDKYVIQSAKVWDLHQNILLGHSANPAADKLTVLEYADALVANRGRDVDYLIRAIIELEHFDASCEYATELLSKIQDPSANADNFITAGFIHSRCTNLEKAAESFRQGLALEPVDLGYQVTRMYSGILYALGDYAALKELLEPILPDPELLGMPFWFYSAVLSEEGKKKKAQEYYEQGVTYGADEKWIMPMLYSEEASKRLLKHLSEFMN